jgi:PKD repeat protein
MLSLTAAAAVNSPQDSSSTLSFTLTTTSSYFVTTGGGLTVNFNSVQLDTISPQAYSFGVVATASPGASITMLYWDFGDGNTLRVPYCCQSQVSEVRYHAYTQPGPYTVHVWAMDSANQLGQATVTVNWPTPIPEYPSLVIPLLGALVAALVTLKVAKTKRTGGSLFL